jgi:hypothetical protein
VPRHVSKSLESTVAGGRSPIPGDGRGATDDGERKTSRPGLLARFFLQEDLNFLLTNRIPRRLATRLMGWFSAIESRWLAAAVVALWRRLDPELDLAEAKTPRFTSLRDCFTRELRAGARPIAADADLVTSPCDAIVGALGTVERGMAIQAKGFQYPLKDLLVDDERVVRHAGGRFVTLRLKASFYHRFHAPDGLSRRARRLHLGRHLERQSDRAARVERLFCRNERPCSISCCRSPTRRSRSCRSPRSSSRASACTACPNLEPALPRSEPHRLARVRTGAARRWAGSNTGRRSSSSPPAASSSPKASSRARPCVWGARS